MKEFSIIPVLDLMRGQVVHGKAGARESYRPIDSPFGAASDAVQIARGLSRLAGSRGLYLADLDAIQGNGNQAPLCREIKQALPKTEIWLDAGFTDATSAGRCQAEGMTPVIGSECLTSGEQWHAIRQGGPESLILSLDFDAAAFRGPGALLEAPATWPDRIIVMTLGAVGSAAGPDLPRLKSIRQKAQSETAIYAAGGVRGVGDLEAVAETGARGALVATALHARALTETEIAAFLGRRRLSAPGTTP